MTGHRSELESDSERYSSDATVQYDYSESVAGNTALHICSFTGCDRSFKKRWRLLDHLLTHGGHKAYKCGTEGCGKAYTSKTHLKRHIISAHVQAQSKPCDTFKCDVKDCGKTYSSRAALKKHTDRSHCSTPRYACTVDGCGESFMKRFQLRHHQYSHQGTLAFQCPVDGCHKKFDQSSHIKRHIKIHDGYTCTVSECQQKFSTWSLLRKHTAESHKKSHRCSECDKKCSSKSLLKRHKSIKHSTVEEGVPLYTCKHDDCSKAYPDLRNLTSHVRVSHDQKSYDCTVNGCSKTFRSKQKRIEHEKIHSKESSASRDTRKQIKKRTNAHRKKTLAGKLCRIDDSSKSKHTTSKNMKSCSAVSNVISTEICSLQCACDMETSEKSEEMLKDSLITKKSSDGRGEMADQQEGGGSRMEVECATSETRELSSDKVLACDVVSLECSSDVVCSDAACSSIVCKNVTSSDVDCNHVENSNIICSAVTSDLACNAAGSVACNNVACSDVISVENLVIQET